MKRSNIAASTSTPKIILKPRLAQTPATPSVLDEDEDDIDEGEVQTKREDSEGVLDEGEPGDEEPEEGEVEGEGSGVEETVPEGGEPRPFPRPRGRPRGRGRGVAPGGPSRARGRGRGRGRARGRGRGGLTIRLPKRDGEDGDEAQAEEGQQDGRPFMRVGGKLYFIEGDEFVTDPDEKGDEKIDADGNLLGGAHLLSLHIIDNLWHFNSC